MKVRISHRVLQRLDRSGANVSSDPATQSFANKVWQANVRQDGSVLVDITDDERAVLLDYVDSWRRQARQRIGRDGSLTPLHEYNALEALTVRLTEGFTWSRRPL
jgi:hypothetical protein